MDEEQSVTFQDTIDAIRELRKDLDGLMGQRIHQSDIPPGTIKQRHVGEGVIFLRSGLDASLPTTGEGTQLGSAFYWATDTFKLYGWTGTVWKSVTLS